ncbi:MAG: hypothetical protein Q4B65_00530 [Candidatus Saccharibacteria bacterium]|nr:hypothetical protein [Candidatus Saccharibacteria bacterium]
MLNKSKNIALICGGASIVITILSYLLIFNDIFVSPIRWVSLLFIILSEAISTIKTLVIRKNILTTPNIATSIAYVAATILISIIFVGLFPSLIREYILLNLLVLCILIVADIISLYSTNRIATEDNKLAESQATLRHCADKAASLSIEFGDTDYKEELNDIVELLKYSDNSHLSGDESIILGELDELSSLLENNDDRVKAKIVEIKKKIKLRSIKVASSKRGKY